MPTVAPTRNSYHSNKFNCPVFLREIDPCDQTFQPTLKLLKNQYPQFWVKKVKRVIDLPLWNKFALHKGPETILFTPFPKQIPESKQESRSLTVQKMGKKLALVAATNINLKDLHLGPDGFELCILRTKLGKIRKITREEIWHGQRVSPQIRTRSKDKDIDFDSSSGLINEGKDIAYVLRRPYRVYPQWFVTLYPTLWDFR